MLSVKTFTFNPIQENTYVVSNEQGQCCIIDPGCYFPAEKEKLKSEIEKSGLKPELLLNTHCHLDHVFGNKYVHETWGLPLHLHEFEKQVLEFAPQSGELWQMPFENYEGPLIFLKEGTTISLGKDELEIRWAPGHSPGSVAFYNAAANFIIGGDVLFQKSIGRTDLPGGDYDTLIESIETQFYTLPDETIVYSGHGPETKIGFEKKHNPFIRMD